MSSTKTPIAEYFDLKTNAERLKMLCRIMNLEEPILIGTYSETDKKQKFTSLINPFTGSNNVTFVKGTQEITEVFYDGNLVTKKNIFKEGSQYLFRFISYGYNDENEKKEYKKNVVTHGKLIKVVPGTELELLNISLEELEKFIPINQLSAPIIKANNPDKMYITNNFYTDYFANHIRLKEEELEIQVNKYIELEKDLKIRENKLQNQIQNFEEKEAFISKLLPVKSLPTSFNLNLLDDDILSDSHIIDGKISLHDIDNSIIKTLQENFKSQDNLNYDIHTIKNVIAGIQADLLLILYGPSGTGKTSMISSLANHLGAKYKVIPVQSSWLDRQDLFGYFNPISKMYTSTPFLDTILEAKKDLSHLYFIGLDEMNLSQVEYYLADVLSLSEHKIPIPLYSKQEYESSLNEVQWYLKQRYSLNNEEDNERLLNEKLQVDELASFKYLQQLQNLLEFPHELELPPNLRFIGTINNDGSTKALSPKVIDRSLFIEMKNQREVKPDTKNKTYKKISLIVEKNDNKSINMNKKIEDKYSKLNEILKDFNAQLNKRTFNHIVLLEQSLRKFNMKDKEISDAIIYNKVLPKINIYLTQENNRTTELAHEISALTDESSNSSKKFKKMAEIFFETKVLSFWE